jgi:hypothetical protein
MSGVFNLQCTVLNKNKGRDFSRPLPPIEIGLKNYAVTLACAFSFSPFSEGCLSKSSTIGDATKIDE